jgi:hypothetical protein
LSRMLEALRLAITEAAPGNAEELAAAIARAEAEPDDPEAQAPLAMIEAACAAIPSYAGLLAARQWLQPEEVVSGLWADIAPTLLPTRDQLWEFGGEMFIGHKDGSVASAQATVASMPITNLQDPQPRRRARLIGSSASIAADLGSEVPVDCVALISTTLGVGAMVQVRLSNVANFSVTLADTGLVNAEA